MRMSPLVLLLAACRLAPADPQDVARPDLQPPVLTDLTWTCDGELARWQLDASTEGWTAGGELVLTRDGRYAEQHEVPSISAAADGSTDRLRLRLDIVADWRNATSGSSTAFLCGAPPDGVVVFRALDGQVADCAWVGPGTTWQDLDGAPVCDDPFVVGE